jgi:hypothetical protein
VPVHPPGDGDADGVGHLALLEELAGDIDNGVFE